MLAKLAATVVALALLVFALLAFRDSPSLDTSLVYTSPVERAEQVSLGEAPDLAVEATTRATASSLEDDRLSPSDGAEPKSDKVAARVVRSNDVAYVVGRVVASTGFPLRGADVRVVPDDLGLKAASSTEGEFGIEVPYSLHANYLFKVVASDFYTQGYFRVGQGSDATPMIPGGAGKPTDIGEVQLADALVLSGRVLDEQGRALEGAWASARGASRIMTAADGTFRLPHVRASVESMTVSLAEYEKARVSFSAMVGAVQDLGDVVMVKAIPELVEGGKDPVCTFRLVDSKTEAGLLEYRASRNQRLTLGAYSIGKVDRDAKYMRTYASPEIQLRAIPGEDTVTFAATGYRTTSVSVKDVAATGVQVVRMRKAPSVAGRVVRSGRPVPFAAVHFILGKHEVVVSAAELEGAALDGGVLPVHATGAALPEKQGPLSSGWNAGIRRVIYADEDGRFSLPLSKERAGAVTVSESGDWSEVLLFERRGRGDTALGDLELVAPSRVTGRVEFSGGESLAGTIVELLGHPGQSTEVDDAGRFTFEESAAGNVFLMVRVDEAINLSSGIWIQRFHVRAESGQTSDHLLSVQTRGTTMIEFTVTVNGAPAAGYSFSVAPAQDRDSRSGQIDVAGRLTKRVPTGIPLRVSIRNEGLHMFLGEKPVLQADQSALAVDFRYGSLAVTMPADAGGVDDFTVSIGMDDLAGPRGAIYGQLGVRDDGRIEARFEGLPLGRQSIRLTAKRYEAPFTGDTFLESTFVADVVEGEVATHDL